MSFADMLIAFLLLSLILGNCGTEASHILMSYDLGFVTVNIQE